MKMEYKDYIDNESLVLVIVVLLVFLLLNNLLLRKEAASFKKRIERLEIQVVELNLWKLKQQASTKNQ